MNEDERAIMRDYADGLPLAKIATRHGLDSAGAALTFIMRLGGELDRELAAKLLEREGGKPVV